MHSSYNIEQGNFFKNISRHCRQHEKYYKFDKIVRFQHRKKNTLVPLLIRRDEEKSKRREFEPKVIAWTEGSDVVSRCDSPSVSSKYFGVLQGSMGVGCGWCSGFVGGFSTVEVLETVRRQRRRWSREFWLYGGTLIITCVNVILHSGSAIQMLNYIGSWLSQRAA